MINENFIYLALIINSIGGLSYLIYTIQGKVRPNRVTWFLWGAIPLIAFAAQRDQGVGVSSLLTLGVGILPLLIFLASFVNKKSYWELTRNDKICAAFSIFGLILWLLTGVGNIAIVFSILADSMAALPTVIKSYHHPESESYVAYAFTVIASVVTILTINNWNFATYAFPIYILLMEFLLAILIRFRVGKRASLKKSVL